MKRRSFLTTLAAAFGLPRLPAATPKKLILIPDEMTEMPGYDPLTYHGEFKWVNLAPPQTDPHGRFAHPIAHQ